MHILQSGVNVFMQETTIPGSLETSFKNAIRSTDFSNTETLEDIEDNTMETSLDTLKEKKLQLINFYLKKGTIGPSNYL